MFLRRLKLSEFLKPGQDANAYPELPQAFKVCCISASKDPDDAEIIDWVGSIPKGERNAFKNGMGTLLKVANAGRPLETHYDQKKCHPVHRFHHQGVEHVIWRIRAGDMRLMFYYGQGRILLLVDSFPKYKDKLTKAQKLYAEDKVKSYLDAVNIEFTESQQ